jgi:branched-chain amino acid transport system substrate-binding protein
MRVGRWVALLAAIAVIGAIVAPAATAQQKFPAVDQPGVTSTEIKVGGIFTDQGDPTGGTSEDAVDGVKAFFAYANSLKGIYGRKLVLDSARDDNLGNNSSEAQALVSSDVFAALPISVQLFTGADTLAESGIPTFGWLINGEWGSEDSPSPPNFFGEVGSFHCFTCAQPGVPQWLAKQLKLKKVGVLAFNVPQSSGCAEGLEASFKKYPTADVVYSDKALSFGQADYSAQVAEMIKKGVNLVITCIDGQGAATLAREMKKQGLDATLILPNAYNHELISANADVLDGAYTYTPYATFETKPKPAGIKLYEKWIAKTGGAKNENSLVGWINGAQLLAGLKAAGPDFTREKVIDAINASKDFTADGIVPAIDWTTAHTTDNICFEVSKITGGGYKPSFNAPGKPFMCFPKDLKTIPAKPQLSA